MLQVVVVVVCGGRGGGGGCCYPCTDASNSTLESSPDICDAGHLEAKVMCSNALTGKRWGMSRQTRKRQYLKARGKLSKDRIFRFFGKNF